MADGSFSGGTGAFYRSFGPVGQGTFDTGSDSAWALPTMPSRSNLPTRPRVSKTASCLGHQQGPFLFSAFQC